MYSGKLITFGMWLMIGFNILLALGSVWSFQRMSPEIDSIYQRNVVSLDACEKMLLAMTGSNVDIEQFQLALQIAGNNITESGEQEVINRIKTLFRQLRQGDTQARNQLPDAITALNNFNRQAIINAARRTQQLRSAGAWGIVFMSMFFFTAAIIFEQRLRRTLLAPLQEIASVMEARKHGDKYRRCALPFASNEVKRLFAELNNLLD